MKKFTYTSITHFNNCNHCPFNKAVRDDYDSIHYECEYEFPYKLIKSFKNGNDDKDNRNSEGILDSCPFLKNNQIKEEN